MKSRESNIDETALWQGVRQGDRASFESIYKEFFKPLYSYGRKICSNPVTLDDAIHDLFLDVWKYREKLATTTSVKFYLFRALRRRIVKNENRDLGSSIFDFHDEDIFQRKTHSHEEYIISNERQSERVSILKKHLNNLSQRQYEALALRFYEDFSYEEIASLLDVNEQSARNLVQRGLEQLRSFSKIFSSLVLIISSTLSL
jgi:RNA polymerase sigma-70 factor (ECF subfamily)